MLPMRHQLVSLLTVLTTAVAIGAQDCNSPNNGCDEVENSGCRNAPAPAYFGDGRVGTTITLDFSGTPPDCQPGGYLAVAMGACLEPPMPIGDPTCVSERTCSLALTPWVTVAAAIVPIQIPNNPALVGQGFCFQGLCLRPTDPTRPGPCVSLSKAVRVRLRPA